MNDQQLYAAIKANKQAILDDLKAGNVYAKTIVSTHDMMVRHPDPIAYAILEMTFLDWLKAREANDEA